MSRKFFQKWLPSHATVRENRYMARYGHWFTHHNLWHLHRRSVAGGVAVGMFAGMIPGSNPVQFTAAALLALACHVNLPLAVIVTLYSNPFTIVPLYIAAIALGRVVLGEGSGALPDLGPDLEGKGLGEWMPAMLHWLASLGKPLLVGLPLLALLLSVVSYFVVRVLWRWYAIRKWHRRSKERFIRDFVP
jgi:uncharacterized protein (DUF2062 family)